MVYAAGINLVFKLAGSIAVVMTFFFYPQGEKLLKTGIDDLKIATKRYAKKQEKWVMNRLIRRSDRQV